MAVGSGVQRGSEGGGGSRGRVSEDDGATVRVVAGAAGSRRAWPEGAAGG